MATLWEMMVFSESSKFWKTSGLRTFCTPAVSVSLQLKDKLLACHRRADPYSCGKLYILQEPAQEPLRKAAILASQSGSLQAAGLKVCIHHQHMTSRGMGWKPLARSTSWAFCWGNC